MSADYIAKLRAKGLANTGITEEITAQLYKKKGSTVLVIAELTVDETHEKADGTRKVDLIVDTIEPVVDGNLNGQAVEAVRRVQRALYVNRQTDQQLPMPGESTEPTVEEVVSAMDAFVEKDQDGEATGFWDGDPDHAEPEQPDPENDADEVVEETPNNVVELEHSTS